MQPASYKGLGGSAIATSIDAVTAGGIARVYQQNSKGKDPNRCHFVDRSPGMKIQYVTIDAVHSDPAKVQRHPLRNFKVIKASLARFG